MLITCNIMCTVCDKTHAANVITCVLFITPLCLPVSLQCCVFVNVSPDVKDVVETLSTLQFGSTIRQVSLGKTTQNIVPSKASKTVKQN